MKRVLLFTAGILMAASAATVAQTTTHEAVSKSEYCSLGPVAGFGTNWVSNMGGSNRFMPSGYLGIGLVHAKDAHWGWGGELVLSSEGYKIRDVAGNTITAAPLYLRLPLRGYYFFGDYRNTVRPKVYLGPSFGFKVGESDNINGSKEAYMAQNMGSFRTFDLGINAGAGVNIKLCKGTWLNMDLGYTQGLLDAVKDNANRYNTNQNLAFSAGVLFGLK